MPASRVTLNGELMFPNDYLAAVELKGRDCNVTLAAVSKEALQMKDGSKKGKMVLRFEKTTKKLVCNKTNADVIAHLHGAEATKWVGKRITLYPTRCLAFGEMVDCIRVREKVPTKADTTPPQMQTGTDAIGDVPDATPAPEAQTGGANLANERFWKIVGLVGESLPEADAEATAKTFLDGFKADEAKLADSGFWAMVWSRAQKTYVVKVQP